MFDNFKETPALMIPWKSTFRSLIICSLVTLYACSKDDQTAVPPVDEKVTVDLALIYPAPTGTVNPGDKFELIISSSTGEVLLDTTGFANSQFFGRFLTSEKKVDLTTIFYDPSTAKQIIHTYKSVDPTDWDTIAPWFGQRWLNPNKPLSSGEVQFINPPSYTGTPHFSSYIGSSSYVLAPPSGSGIKVNYTRAAGVPIYLLFPVEGRYKIHLPLSGKDTVDISTMDRAKRIPFDLSAQQTIDFTRLFGITDTTDVGKSIVLYNSSVYAQVPDLVYPTAPLQKYLFFLKGKTGASELFGLSSFSDSVPGKYNLPTAANYNIGSSLPDNFSVNFSGEKPFVYTTKWVSTDVSWTIYAPVESTQYKPVSMLRNMNAISLRNVNISAITLSQFGMERSKNMDYDRYMQKNMISRFRWDLRDYVTAEYQKNY